MGRRANASAFGGSVTPSLTRCFSSLACAGVISPSATARCTSSHDAICMRSVVSRMLSAA